jgi:hypothetical protein
MQYNSLTSSEGSQNVGLTQCSGWTISLIPAASLRNEALARAEADPSCVNLRTHSGFLVCSNKPLADSSGLSEMCCLPVLRRTLAALI